MRCYWFLLLASCVWIANFTFRGWVQEQVSFVFKCCCCSFESGWIEHHLVSFGISQMGLLTSS